MDCNYYTIVYRENFNYDLVSAYLCTLRDQGIIFETTDDEVNKRFYDFVYKARRKLPPFTLDGITYHSAKIYTL
jgi:hypothetical protein